jgi:hypothetical protein
VTGGEASRRDAAAVATWKRSFADGSAGKRCDELIRRRHAEQGVPRGLARVLARREPGTA